MHESCQNLQDFFAWAKPLVIAEQFRFHKREQKEGESVMGYAASLQKLAEHCAFGATLSETLRDRFVCGMRDEGVQKRLLTKTDLTFAKALETAEIAERAAKDAEQLQSVTKQEQEVLQVAEPLRTGRQSG